MSAKTKKTKSDELLAKIQDLKSNEKQTIDVEEEKYQIVIFTLLGDYYAFVSSDIKEVLTVGKINYVPASPAYILGIINVRGDIESVLDIHSLFGFPAEKVTPQSRVVIAEKDGIRSGILVGSVEDVVDIPRSSMVEPISTLNENVRNFVSGETRHGEMNITMIDVGKIFGMIRDQGN